MARHLLVTNDYLPKTGGIQVYLHELWRRLESGRAVVLTASSHPDAALFDATTDVVIERVPTRTLYFPTRKNRRAIEEAVARHQADLVILDPAWPLGLLGPSLSVPYGVVLHGAEVTIPARLPLIASSLRYVLRHASFVLGAGEYPVAQARRNAGDLLPEALCVPPGVDTSRFVPLSSEERRLAREEFGYDSDDVVVVSYSRLVPRKGMDTLIRAAARLRDEFPQLRVEIGGAGRDHKRLERLIARHRAPVTLRGRVEDAVLPRWIGASDLMVMDCRSRWGGLEEEGFGIVFLEAAACGVAQIAGRSGGSHEAVRDGETGLVVNAPRSVRALSRALRGLLEDAEWRTDLGAQARETVLDSFEWDVLATRLSNSLAPFDHFGDVEVRL